jgi:hypothetical protein
VSRFVAETANASPGLPGPVAFRALSHVEQGQLNALSVSMWGGGTRREAHAAKARHRGRALVYAQRLTSG